MTLTTIEKGKTPRKALRLPNLHFIVCDDWLEKLGEKSFCLWLKLQTKVDRTHGDRDTVRQSQVSLAESLGMSKSTLLRLIKPLYEYGLIDYRTWYWEQKNVDCENIVVFEYPQNNPALAFEPLEKVREWENRTDEKYSFAKKGGRPKKEEQPEEEPKKEEPKVPTPVPTTTPVPTIKEEVQPVVHTEFDFYKEQIVENKGDLETVVNWINKNYHYMSENAICYVIKQLATYPEPIRKTGTFITNAIEKASPLHRPVTAYLHKKPVEEVHHSETRVPFYNWLEN